MHISRVLFDIMDGIVFIGLFLCWGDLGLIV